MLHSLLLYNPELNMIRAALKKLDADGLEAHGSDPDLKLRDLRHVNTITTDLLRKLDGIGGKRYTLTTEELEQIASALVHIGQDDAVSFAQSQALDQYTHLYGEKFDRLCTTIGQHLGRRFY